MAETDAPKTLESTENIKEAAPANDEVVKEKNETDEKEKEQLNEADITNDNESKGLQFLKYVNLNHSFANMQKRNNPILFCRCNRK